MGAEGAATLVLLAQPQWFFLFCLGFLLQGTAPPLQPLWVNRVAWCGAVWCGAVWCGVGWIGGKLLWLAPRVGDTAVSMGPDELRCAKSWLGQSGLQRAQSVCQLLPTAVGPEHTQPHTTHTASHHLAPPHTGMPLQAPGNGAPNVLPAAHGKQPSFAQVWPLLRQLEQYLPPAHPSAAVGSL